MKDNRVTPVTNGLLLGCLLSGSIGLAGLLAAKPAHAEVPADAFTAGGISRLPDVNANLNGFVGSLGQSMIGSSNGVIFAGLITPNSPPAVDANGSAAGIDYTTTWVEGSGSVPVADVNLTVSDDDNASLASATVTLTNPLDGAAESLSALTVGTGITASYNSATGVLSLVGAATVDAYAQVLRSVSYDNSLQNPNTTPRVLDIVVNDGAESSVVAHSTIAITATNNAPVVDINGSASGVDYAAGFTEDAGLASIVATDLTVSDADSTALASASITITNLKDGSAESLAVDTTGTAITASYNTGTGVLSLSGTDTVANYQKVLRTATYNNTSQNPNASARLITFTVNDGTTNSATATTTLSVTPVNDAPVATADNVTVREGTSLDINVLANDTDADGDTLQVSEVTNGQLGTTAINADGTIRYTAKPNVSGSDAFTYTVIDGHGGSATATVNITVTDATAPLLTIDAPANGAYLKNLTLIYGTVSNPDTTKLEVFLQRGSDGAYWSGRNWSKTVPVALPTTLAGTKWIVPAALLPSGANLRDENYAIIARAADPAGNKAEKKVVIQIDQYAPVITFVAPTNGQTLSKLSVVAGRAIDPSGGSGVARVVVSLRRLSDGRYWSGRNWSTTAISLPAQVSGQVWRLLNPPTGFNLKMDTYRLTAVAIDRASNAGVGEVLFKISSGTTAATTTRSASSTALSIASANVASNAVSLTFTAPLTFETATDANNYVLKVNDQIVSIESVSVKGNTVVLTSSAALQVGDKLTVSWDNLSDTANDTVTGQTGSLTVR